MPTKKGVECYLSTASGKLTEYWEPDDPEVRLQDSGNAACCYVQSQDDFEFTVTINTDRSFAELYGATHLRTRFTFDGSPYKPRKSRCRVGGRVVIDRCYLPGQPVYCQTMKFSKLEVTEDKILSSASKDLKLGEIEVLLWRYQQRYKTLKPLGVIRGKKASGKVPNVDAGRKVVSEKALKGRDIGHTVVGGGVQKATKIFRYDTGGDELDPLDGEPYMRFKFFYRSERALKGLGLIPRTPSLSPAPLALNRAELSKLPHEELVERLLAVQGDHPDIKPEPEEHVGTTREGGRLKRTRGSGIVTIDLTDD